jgi:hypothetical protein
MKLRWEHQLDGAWHAFGQRKDDLHEKVMGKIIPPGVSGNVHTYYYWLFMDENIAGGGHDLEAIKQYMESMVVNQ